MNRWLAAAFCVGTAVLAVPAWQLRIADAHLDPLGRIDAQDEAIYTHGALRMAQRGDWRTPYFLDRYALYKPPLLYWLAGLSVTLFGASAWALRLPSILAGAGTVCLVVAWVRRDASSRHPAAAIWASAAAALLLLSNRPWPGTASLCLT